MKYDFLIVGSGMFGSVFSEQVRRKGKTCLIIEKNDHIAGNCYTKKVENIDVHVHGPHIFNTNNERIWEYVNNFSKFNQYTHRVKASNNGKIYSIPINLMTLHQVYGTTNPEEAYRILEDRKVKIDNPTNLEDWCLSQIGPELYELFVKGYTKKQWGRNCRDLPSSIIRRLPIRMTYDDRYHESKYTGQPVDGYTSLIANIIGDCPIELGTDFFKLDWKKYANKLVYTGTIDQFYDYAYGKLDYRTLRFEEKIMAGDFQGVAQMNYTNEDVPHTRITEHKHFNFKNQEKTVVTWEYPSEWKEGSEPYYPIGDEKNKIIYDKYKKLIDKNILIEGRLGRYQYMDMDAVIASAIKKAEEI